MDDLYIPAYAHDCFEGDFSEKKVCKKIFESKWYSNLTNSKVTISV